MSSPKTPPRHTSICDCPTCERFRVGIFGKLDEPARVRLEAQLDLLAAPLRAFRRLMRCAPLGRFAVVLSLGLIETAWFFAADHIDRAWPLNRDLLLALTLGVRFCLWSVAAFLALQGRQGLRDGR